jgi:hypothetical protein
MRTMKSVSHIISQMMVNFMYIILASYYAKEPKVQNRSTTSVVGNNEDFLKFCEAINEKLLKNEF